MPEKVLVTGASGFLATYIIKQLVEQGYSVVGTVRSPEKGDFYVKQYPSFQYEIVKDISNMDAFDHVYKAHPDIKYVQHIASPFTFGGTDPEKDLIVPAINGTLSALTGAKKYGSNVQKVVITSSFASILDYPSDISDPNITISEKVWSPITLKEGKLDNVRGYYASKTFAEKAAWEFVKTEHPAFAITTIQVPFVLGPPLNDIGITNINTSNSTLIEFMRLPRDAPIPERAYFYVDVRDAAATHVKAMTTQGLDNKRCMSYGGSYTAQRFIDTLRKLRPELQDKLPVGTPNSYSADKYTKVDNSESQKYLQLQYLSFDKTVGDTVDRLLELERQG